MATINFYLDTRKQKQDGTYPIRAAINHKGATAYLSLNLSVALDQWDKKKRRIVGHYNKEYLNRFLLQKYAELTNAILSLQEEGKLKGLTARGVRDAVVEYIDPSDSKIKTFGRVFDDFTKLKENPKTRELYEGTWKKIQKYDRKAFGLAFEQINIAWIDGFFLSLAKESPSVNARNIHLRNIRAVFNYAIDNEFTTAYPFRRYKIKPVETPKRNLSAKQLKMLFDYPAEDWQQKYVDALKLSFFLIGMNIGDLLTVAPDCINNGRLEYNRLKTHRFYSVKVEPEALELIEKYKGERHLLNLADGCKHYRHFAYRMNEAIQRILPKITTYWARHSWATIAASLDIPKDTIAQALGHGGKSVTDIYIQFDKKKVDKANRAVIDYVLYGKTTE